MKRSTEKPTRSTQPIAQSPNLHFLKRKGASLFECVDAHTCGNPVRVVVQGGPELNGMNMSDRRLDFLENHDWIRRGLMFEPRGHDMMSGSILYPPQDPENDLGILFIETSGCLPMCGHGTIGTVTVAIENDLVKPHQDGTLRIETPAGLVFASYHGSSVPDQPKKVSMVRIQNVPSYLAAQNVLVKVPALGDLVVDVSFGGNFYAIVDPQDHFRGIQNHTADQLVLWSRTIRDQVNACMEFVHPLNPSIRGCSHVLWAGETMDPSSTARNAVFYGNKAIDRSPCGTGTSARMAQWYAKGKLAKGQAFIHESIIGSKFTGTIEGITELAGREAIIPSIEGWAKVYGHNKILIDPTDDPYAYGFQVL